MLDTHSIGSVKLSLTAPKGRMLIKKCSTAREIRSRQTKMQPLFAVRMWGTKLTTPSWLWIPAPFSDSYIRKPNRLNPAFCCCCCCFKNKLVSQKDQVLVFFFSSRVFSREGHGELLHMKSRNYCGATELYQLDYSGTVLQTT